MEVDTRKRARLFFLAVVIAVAVFVIRVGGFVDIGSSLQLFIMSAAFFLFTYICLIWVFKFQVGLRSILFIIPQSALYVAMQVLFLTLFFFRGFERVYEVFLLLGILIFIVVSTYVSFLMTNIFNVSQFRQIPLVRVAKTASYVITLLSVYFAAYSLLAVEAHMLITLLTLPLAFFLVIVSHLFHMGLSMVESIRDSLVIGFSMSFITVGSMLLGSPFEITSLMPTALAFSMVGIEMNRETNDYIKRSMYMQYLVVFVVAFLLNLFIVF